MNIQIKVPTLFGIKQVIIENLIAIFPQIVFGGSIGTVFGGSIGFGFIALRGDLIPLTDCGESSCAILIPACSLLLIGLTLLLIGLTFLFYAPSALLMNFYIKRIVKKLGLSCNYSNEYICQLSLKPRLYSGLRAFLEDADDVGILRINSDQVLFTGDHVAIIIPFSMIESVEKYNVGWRGFWISGKRIKIQLKGANEYSQVEFLERQSTTLIGANKISNNVFTLISEKVKINSANQ